MTTERPEPDRSSKVVSAQQIGQVNMGGFSPLTTGGSLRSGRILYRGSQPRVPWYFVARTTELESLTDDTGASVIVAVRGIGGVGKTQLAARFFNDHQHAYDAAVWINAERDDGLADLSAAARQAGLVDVDGEPPTGLGNRLWDELEAQGRRWLVVVDNARNPGAVEPWLPRGQRGRVLITSRHRSWGGIATPLTVGPLAPIDGGELLRTVSGRPGDPDAEELSERLGGLPLALVLAASRCRHGTSLGSFSEQWRSRPDFGRLADGTDDAYTRTVHAIWRDSLSIAEQRQPMSPALLAVLASLDWRAVDRRWLLTELCREGALGSQGTIVDCLGVLSDLSLVALDDNRIAVQHSLIVEGILADRTAHVVELLADVFDASLVADPATGWNATVEETVRHLYAGAALDRPLPAELLPATARGLLFLFHHGDHQRSITIAERLAPDYERILGPEHPDTLSARAGLAASYRSSGRTADAMAIEEQVVADRERILGPEHPDTLRARANLEAMRRDPPV